MKKILTALTLLIVVFAGCNNDDDNTPQNPVSQLPPPTQTGENTFGCLVNGEPFVVTNTNNMVAIYQGGGLSISGGKNLNGSYAEISMFIGESSIGGQITQGSEYTLINATTQKGEFYNEGQNCFYFTTPIYTGILEITHFDNINYIVSGRFEFNAISDNCGDEDVINITDGRFDIQYIP